VLKTDYCPEVYGLKELTILRDTIFEISRINKVEPNFAFRKFYKDTEDQYDAKLDFQKKNEEMKKSLSDTRQDLRSISLVLKTRSLY
jgi:hypothetical protein